MARRNACLELVPDPADPTRTRLVPCGRPGHVVRLQCPAGRRPAIGGPYCDEHGGAAKAEEDARSEWNFVAPASVGGEIAVDRAGRRILCSVHAYVVVRQAPDSQGGVWLAFLGLGSFTEPISNPRRRPNNNGGKHRRGSRCSDGTHSFSTREAAEAQAREAWRERLDHDVSAIRSARGGTLAWGIPVEPASEPIVIVLEQGDSRSGWDVAATLPRRTREGSSAISGVRPSGEIA